MRHPRTVLIGVLLMSLLAASQLPKLQVAISPQSLIIEGDPDQAFYQDTLATFGSDRITIVYVEDPQLFLRDKLESIREVIDSIERLPFVEKTRSLFNVPEIRVLDEFISTDPFLKSLPDDSAEAAGPAKCMPSFQRLSPISFFRDANPFWSLVPPSWQPVFIQRHPCTSITAF